jgi:small subunit ribosomal protein S21
MKDSYKKPRKNFSSRKAQKGGESSAVVVTDKFAHIEAVQAQPLEVKVYNNNFDKALRAFRALVQKERILSLYKEKQSYEKPSDKRRRKRNEMKRKRVEMDNPRPPRDSKKSSFKSRKPKSDRSPQ